VTEDLARAHDALIVRDLGHWDRDAFAHGFLTATVSESQSHAERRKIVLVDTKRHRHAAGSIVEKITRLNGGRLRARIEMYDWRVLEGCATHELGAEALKRYFMGATIFDEARERTIFTSTIPWLQGLG